MTSLQPFALLATFYNAAAAQNGTRALYVPGSSSHRHFQLGVGYLTRIVHVCARTVSTIPGGDSATITIKIDNTDITANFGALVLDDTHQAVVATPLGETRGSDPFVIDSTADTVLLSSSVVTTATTGDVDVFVQFWGYRYA